VLIRVSLASFSFTATLYKRAPDLQGGTQDAKASEESQTIQNQAKRFSVAARETFERMKVIGGASEQNGESSARNDQYVFLTINQN